MKAARTQLLAALEQYNARVRQCANFEGLRWSNPPDFLELDLD